MKSVSALVRTGAILALGSAAVLVQAQVPHDERRALIRIYQETGGTQWHNDEGWLGELGTECDWYGVVCQEVNGRPRVHALQLGSNNLQGELPGYLAALSELVSLGLAGNRLSGRVPTDLWFLDSLEGLFISDNDFSGPIPNRLLTLENRTLDLSGNRFDGYLIENLQATAAYQKTLVLSHNLLQATPPPAWREGFPIERLDLSSNRLSGKLDASHLPAELIEFDVSNNTLTRVTGLDALDAPDFESLDLSRNRIDTWPENPDQQPFEKLDLSHNRLSAPLPEWLASLPLTVLDVSNNDIAGQLPESLSGLDLLVLDLSHNRLEGSIDHAVDAMSLEETVYLDVSSNGLSGALPESIMALQLIGADVPSDLQARVPFVVPFQPGLNLCWNDFDPPDETLAEFIDAHHFAGSYTGCIQERLPVGAGLSGSWFNPARSGEGIVQHQLDNGLVLLFWFTYPSHGAAALTRSQLWLFRVADPNERTVLYDGLNASEGRFGAGGTALFSPDFRLRTSRSDEERQQFSYSYGFDSGGSPGIRTFSVVSDQYDQVALTRLAGTTCDNQQPHQWISGAWYDPERSGEGFMVEVNQDGRVVVYWFTHEPNDSGRQAWMIGTGEFADGEVVIEEMIQPVGTSFGEEFDEDEIEHVDWGRLTLTFFDESTGEISYESNLPEYGSGGYPIQRLARPMLAECE